MMLTIERIQFLPLAIYSSNQTTKTPSIGAIGNPQTPTIPDTNPWAKGIKVFVYIPAGAGSGTITVTITGYDNYGNSYSILTSGTLSSSTTGVTTLTVHPALTTASNSVANDLLPGNYSIDVTSNGTALKFAVSYCLYPH